MAMRRKKDTKKHEDEVLVYYSRQEGAWFAHSFRTDQIGCGDCILEAIESLLRGIKTIMDMAAKDADIKVWREAPAEVQAKAKNAKKLPYELIEIAHKRVHGTWPKEVPLWATPRPTARFMGKIDDLALCK